MRRLAAIISGAQTGADRGGLDAAKALSLKTGGYVPRGRRSEDGQVPHEYSVQELDSWSYAPRTRENIRAADATLIFSYGPPSGGSKFTENECAIQAKPHAVVNLQQSDEALIPDIQTWIASVDPLVLNIAGPRESKLPGVQRRVAQLIVAALSVE